MVLKHIVDQHARNAAFLWHLRDQATRRPHYKLAALCRLDERVEAHIDGLRIAGEAGFAICVAALEEGEAGEMFAAMLLAVERHDLRGIARVLDASGGDPAAFRGIASALGFAPLDKVKSILPGLFDPRCPPALHWIGVAACAVNRLDPGQDLDRAVRSEDRRLRCRALEAVGELGRADLRYVVERALEEEDDEVRFCAGWSSALLGSGRAAEVLCDLAARGSRRAEEAMSLAVRRAGPHAAGAFIEALCARPEATRAAVVGIGALGDPAHVPWLLHFMKAPELARVAGEAYAALTGVDLEDAKLEGRCPEGFVLPGPNDDPADEGVALEPDEDLPWPDVGAVAAHWEKTRAGLTVGRRYFLGRPLSAEGLREALRTGRQRQRAAAAIDLALLAPGRPLFEVRAPGFRQEAVLTRQ